MSSQGDGTAQHSSTAATHQVGLRPLVEGAFAPTDLTVAPGDHGRKYVVDQPGLVHVLRDGRLRDDPFLDVRDRVVDLKWGHDERGLLGLAFHPDYGENGRLYARYSAPPREGTPEDWDHTEVLAEFEVDADGERVDPGTERTVMEIPHPHLHHNAGDLAFGPDGYLYLGMGDGGHTGDVGPGHVEGGNGQDVTENLLGSVLRIDVDAEPTEHPRADEGAPGKPDADAGYAVPEDNPLVGEDGLDEYYAWGLRNPYRLSFDSDGRLFTADVGEHLFERVNLVEAGSNYGWNVREGTHCFDPESMWEPPADCPDENDRGEPLIDPIVEYPHIEGVTGAGEFVGSAVVGGHVYEGDAIPDLQGAYVFGDLSKKYDTPRGRLFAATPSDGEQPGEWDRGPLDIAGLESNLLDGYVFSLGRDHDGELYVLASRYLNTRKHREGAIYEVVPPEESEVSGPRYGWFDAANDAYWYSLYNMNSVFVRSGNGIVFPFDEDQFDSLSQELKAVMKGLMQRAKFMMRRKKILENSRNDELPVENPHLIVAPFTTGDPHFVQEPDAYGRNLAARPDADTFRWDREKSSKVVSPAALGWTHLKGITWAKSFEHEFDLAPIATRERPQILGTASQLGVKFALQNGHLLADDGEDMRLVGEYRPADDEVVEELATPEDYAAMLWWLSDVVSFAENGWYGYENPSPMIEVDEIQDLTDRMAAATFREYPPEEALDIGSTRDLGVLLGATGWYGTHAGDEEMGRRAADYANALADAVDSNVAEDGLVDEGGPHHAATQGAVSQGLLWASRMEGVDREQLAGRSVTYLFDELWNDEAGTFASARDATTYRYTPANAGDVIGGLNAVDAALGIDGVKERYARFFDETFNRGRLQRATRWQAYRPEGEHPLPLEQDAGGEHGQAAVYNAAIEYDVDADEWRVADDSFRTAGSMYLANQDLWASVWGGSEFPGRGVPGETDRLPRWEG